MQQGVGVLVFECRSSGVNSESFMLCLLGRKAWGLSISSLNPIPGALGPRKVAVAAVGVTASSFQRFSGAFHSRPFCMFAWPPQGLDRDFSELLCGDRVKLY